MAALLALSATASANFEFYGGASYVTVQPEVLNDAVKIVNEKVGELKELGLGWADDKELKEIKSGFGAFGGLRYWVDPSVAVGGELEYISVGSSGDIEGKLGGDESGDLVDGTIDISAPVFGYGANVAYKVSPEFLVFGGAGYYNLNGSVEMKGLGDVTESVYGFGDGKATLEDSAFGFKAGASYTYPVSDDFSVTARAAYRMLKFEEVEVKEDKGSWEEDLLPKIEEVEEGFELDFSGFEVGLGVVLYF